MKAICLGILSLVYSSVLHSQENVILSFENSKISESSLHKLETFLKKNDCEQKDLVVTRRTKDQFSEAKIVEVQSFLQDYSLKIDHSLFHPNRKENFGTNQLSLSLKNRIVTEITDEVEEPILSEETESIEEYFIEEDSELIEIDPTVYNRLTLRQGTILEIPAYSLVDKNGEYQLSNIKVKALEIMSMEDAILYGTTTNYGDKILESRGMLDIACYDLEGNELHIKKGSEISVNTPQKKSPNLNSTIFKANVNNNSIDWILENENPANFDTTFLFTKLIWSPFNKDEIERNKRSKEIRLMAMKGNGKSNYAIKRKLRKSRIYVKKKSRNNRKRRTVSYPKHKKYLRVNSKMILGDAKSGWHIDETSISPEALFGYYKYAVRTFGKYNIDFINKIDKPKENMIVQTEEGFNTKLFFKKQMVLLAGANKDSETIFRFIPIEQRIVLISSRKLQNGLIEFGYLETKSGKGNYQISNYQTYSNEEYRHIINKLTKIDERLSSR